MEGKKEKYPITHMLMREDHRVGTIRKRIKEERMRIMSGFPSGIGSSNVKIQVKRGRMGKERRGAEEKRREQKRKFRLTQSLWPWDRKCHAYEKTKRIV